MAACDDQGRIVMHGRVNGETAKTAYKSYIFLKNKKFIDHLAGISVCVFILGNQVDLYICV